MYRSLLVILVLLLVSSMQLPNAAQSGSELVGEIESSFRSQGYYVEDESNFTPTELGDLVDEFPRTNYVALETEPPQGASELAARLLERSNLGTVAVITPSEMGAASRDHASEDVAGALRAALEDGNTDEMGDFRAFSEFLGAGVAPVSTWSVVAVAIVGFVLLSLAGRTLLSRRPDSGTARRLEERRAELRQRLTHLANDTAAVSKVIGDDEVAGEHFRLAADLLEGAEAELAAATSKTDCDELGRRLDTIREELEAALALLDDGESTPTPPGSPCFFDATHGGGTVPASVVGTDDVVLSVWICSRDAEKLLEGQRPDPRMVTVGGRRVPAPIAPRTHGGGGLSGLDTFTISIDGMSAPARYRFASGKGRRLRSNGR